MRALSLIALGVAGVIGGVPISVLARDWDITIAAPLGRVNPSNLDKARGVGPRFKFFSAPPELSQSCAMSVRVNVNEGDFVDYVVARTADEFRSTVAGRVHLKPSEAELASVQTAYALSGEGQISSAACANLKAGLQATGHCTGIISGNSYTIIYSYDPVSCRYDNVSVAKPLQSRLSIGDLNDPIPEPDCKTKLEGFVRDIDAVLARNPRSIYEYHDVLNQHFPLRGCNLDLVYNIVSKSKYFRSVGKNGPKTSVFALNSETVFTRGVSVSFGLTDTGDSSLPSAMWSPPFW